ncbi:MAG: ion transporter [Clostridia bacterium]|nr:ion transporter [Clostridia bacterium]MBQ9507468.1 ion transporter [Clostridia bacterium]MBR5423560.1 ion transporter [Clostridia bacterium]
MREKIYNVIDSANNETRLATFYDFFMMAVIVISLIPLAFKVDPPVFMITDKACTVIFIIDYILRWVTADYKFGKKSASSFIRYPISPMAIVDLVSILPSISAVNSGFKVLRVMRMIRALRVLRIFKAARYSKSLQIISGVMKKSKEPLIAVCTLAIAYILVSALVILNVEPDSFSSFFDAVYWATVSLTTVGYGDIYPVTTIGRMVTMLSSLFGIAIVALPSGIITAGYLEELKMMRREQKNGRKRENETEPKQTDSKAVETAENQK